MDETKTYQSNDFEDALIDKTLKEVMEALEERGYKSINQLVGYLMSGDPGYISSHKESRRKIQKFEREKILEFLLNHYLDQK